MTLDPTDERRAEHGHLTPAQHEALMEACVQVYMAADGIETVPEYAARAALAGEGPDTLAAMLPDDTDHCRRLGVNFDPETGEEWPDE